jgi:hypothetical protein
MTHHPAPAIVDGVSPFTTPGTRLVWASGADWLACLAQLRARRIASKVYADLAAHLDELARHPDFIAAQPLEDLTLMQAAFKRTYQPPHGTRRGTSYERVVNEVNNALAALERERRA